MEIKVAMVRAGVTGRELARRLGTSQTWVSTRLNGVTPLDLDDMQRIADALGVTIVELMQAAVRRTGEGTDEIKTALLTADQPEDRPSAEPPSRHIATRPFSPRRRDPSRPVSAIPATRRRPGPARPGNRLMTARA
jgi:transcriptional regulator with XRE-family HTH domain